jgi:RES domain-containing protein
MAGLEACLEIRLARVVSLHGRRARRHLSPWLTSSFTEDWRALQADHRESTSQAIGRAAFRLGAEGLLVPSHVARTRTNLIAFPDNLLTGSSIRATR